MANEFHELTIGANADWQRLYQSHANNKNYLSSFERLTRFF
jgi:hypothetical protein